LEFLAKGGYKFLLTNRACCPAYRRSGRRRI